MGDGCYELIEDARRFGVLRNAVSFPGRAVVDVDDAAGAADCDPAIAAQAVIADLGAAERHDCCADGAVVGPARHDGFLADAVFDCVAAFAQHYHASSVAPPSEICDAASAVDACLTGPLSCVGVEDVDCAAAFSAAADEAHPAPTGGEFEAFHCSLFVGVAVDAGDFADGAGG